MSVKPYPQPNPAVEGSTSRFAVGIALDENGNVIDVLKEAKFKTPLLQFNYDSNAQKTVFKQLSETRTEVISPYLPTSELKELVRLAQILQRPVLIKGEPGSGKTQFAKAVAYEWYGENYKQHFFEWFIKSTSKAVDGLYTFDHVARLRDAYLHNQQNGSSNEAKQPSLTDMMQYRTFGPMGQAFLTSTKDTPSILLIDEIDKADIDFPNDLLLELDERRFQIPQSETGELIIAEYPPVIFITSNDERELPEAFLRRCLFLYIDFPDDSTLLRIIGAHLPDMIESYGEFVDKAVKRFRDLREQVRKDPSDNKRVSTSELLDWLRAYDFDISHGGAALNVDLTTIPAYHQALLKTYQAVYRRNDAIKRQNQTTKTTT